MSPWQGYPVPAVRHEPAYGDRLVRCFAQRPPNVYAMLARSIEQRADYEALVCEGRRWTYAELGSEVGRITAGLRSKGIGAGDRVAMFITNRPEFVFVLFALQRLGAIAVPIGAREARPALAYMLNQCGAKSIVFDAELADRIPDFSDVPSLKLRISIGAAAGAQALASLVEGAGAGPQPAVVNEQSTAVILYTSGTTGHPKGAMLTHLNVAHSVLHYQA